MSDRDAFLAAICAQPDEDTPRLVFADYLEENDEASLAAFIRAQVELARTPPWEPFAVRWSTAHQGWCGFFRAMRRNGVAISFGPQRVMQAIILKSPTCAPGSTR